MMSNAETYYRFLVNEIHTTIVATVDDEDLPVTAAIDMMDCDENSLYFLTAKGKGFMTGLLSVVSLPLRRSREKTPCRV